MFFKFKKIPKSLWGVAIPLFQISVFKKYLKETGDPYYPYPTNKMTFKTNRNTTHQNLPHVSKAVLKKT